MSSQVALVFEQNAKEKDGTILIYGEQNIQNQLLSDQISKNTGYHTLFDHHLHADRLVAKNKNRKFDPIILIDCTQRHPQLIWEELSLNQKLNAPNIKLVLFNIEAKYKGKFEATALSRGISGVFYTDTSIENLFKGLQSINHGELWFSRRVLSDYLQESVRNQPVCPEPGTGLTRRETEVLKYLVTGLSNVEIADKLFLSVHTVKTHVYNLYKKIEVPNRLQAVLWATKHMPLDRQPLKTEPVNAQS